MDSYFIHVREIADILAKVKLEILEDIIIYYILENIPEEYEVFRKIQIGGNSLLKFEEFEARLISKEAIF